MYVSQAWEGLVSIPTDPHCTAGRIVVCCTRSIRAKTSLALTGSSVKYGVVSFSNLAVWVPTSHRTFFLYLVLSWLLFLRLINLACDLRYCWHEPCRAFPFYSAQALRLGYLDSEPALEGPEVLVCFPI